MRKLGTWDRRTSGHELSPRRAQVTSFCAVPPSPLPLAPGHAGTGRASTPNLVWGMRSVSRKPETPNFEGTPTIKMKSVPD